jgi:hypothetical protein
MPAIAAEEADRVAEEWRVQCSQLRKAHRDTGRLQREMKVLRIEHPTIRPVHLAHLEAVAYLVR